MSIKSRAAASGLTAAMLASLVATAVAPAALAAAASVTSTGAGSFPQGGYEQGVFSSAASYTFNEGSANGWGDATVSWPVGAGFTLDIIINTPNVYFDTTTAPTITAPTTLGMSGAFISATDFQVTAGSSDKTLQEAFTVSGFKVAAAKSAALGAVDTRYIFNAGGGPVALFGGGTKTIAGTLAKALGAGVDTWAIVNLNTTSDLFNNASVTYPWVFNSGASNEEDITSGTQSYPCADDPTCSGGQQELAQTPTTFAKNHAVGEPVTQNEPVVGNPILPSLGTVVAAASLSAVTKSVLPGETDQAFGKTSVCENNNRDFATNAVVTIKILTAGALFSMSPTAGVTASTGSNPVTLSNGTSVLSFDRLSATWVVSAKDGDTATLSCINISGFYDIAAGVAPGTKIKVSVTVGSLLSVPASVTNALVGSGITGVSLDVPTVYIGQNDQSTGTIKISESAVGQWTAGPGMNTIQICLEYRNVGGRPMYTRPPFAVVAPGSDLLLRDPTTLTGKTAVMGQTGSGCYPNAAAMYWNIYSPSTTAPSVIYIVGSDASGNPLPITGIDNGPRISLPSNAVPGQVVADLQEGDANGLADFALVPIANGVYFKNPTVTVSGNLPLTPGGLAEPGGDLTISETAPAQLNNGSTVVVTVLPNATQDNQQEYFSAGGLSGLYASNFSVVTNNSGLVAHVDSASRTMVAICVDQRAFQPTLGVLTIKGFLYDTVVGATPGNVKLEVQVFGADDNGDCIQGPTGGPIGSTFPRILDTFVSNAHVGTSQMASNDSAVGSTTVGPFSTSTKVVKPGTSVTIRFQLSPAVAGARLGIWMSFKDASGHWGTWKAHATAYADSNGVVYYVYSTSKVAWASFRVYYAGDLTHGSAWSSGTQARWKK